MPAAGRFHVFNGQTLRHMSLLGFFALVILLLLAGCGRDVSEDATVRLRFSTWGSAEEMAILRGLVRNFEREHPTIQVEILHIPENYFQKLHLMVASDLAPDVMFVNSLNFPVYAAHKVFLPLDALLQHSREVQGTDFYPQALKAFRWEGQIGAVPRDISDLVVFYNRDLFRQAGIAEPTDAWTFEEMRAKARRLTADTDGDGRLDRWGISFNRKPPLYWLPYVWSAGGDVFDPKLKHLALTEARSLEGLRFYQGLHRDFHVAPTQMESGNATMSQLFLQGKLAMMVNGRWSVPVLREQAGFDWDVVTFPHSKAGSRVGIDASGYAIWAKTKHPKESEALVAYLSSRASQRALAQTGLIVPARRDIAESDIFLAPQERPGNSRAFLLAIGSGVPSRTPVRWNEIAEELTVALDPVWDGKTDPQAALSAVEARVNRMLEVR